MIEDEIINAAIKELKESKSVYKMYTEFSFMKDLKITDDEFIKTRYLLKKSAPFEEHTDSAIRLSATGILIAKDYKNWFEYKKSLQPKKDYLKLAAEAISILGVIFGIYQVIANTKLEDENRLLESKYDSLKVKYNQLSDSVIATNKNKNH